MKKLTFWETKKKHLKICFYLLRGSFYLLLNRKFNDTSEGMKIISAFDGGDLVKDFLYNLTNFWLAEDTLSAYGIESDQLRDIVETTSIDDMEDKVQEFMNNNSFHSPLHGESEDYPLIIQTMNPMEKQNLIKFTGLSKDKKN